MIDATWLDELDEFLRIPSISSDPARRDAVVAAGEWVVETIQSSGGTANVVYHQEQPLVVGEVPASNGRDAPTVLLYGHVDVQPPGDLDAWDFEPFAATKFGEWLYGRGVADDKGQLFMLLKATAVLAAADELPVNVRVVCDGEEEVGGTTIADWLAEDARVMDACVIFDTGMPQIDVPAFYLGTRGIWYVNVRVRTGSHDLHSGVYGGAALNAAHVLNDLLSCLQPREGRVPDALREGALPPSLRELEDWADLRAGQAALVEVGAHAADGHAAEDFYVRTFAEPSLDVHGIRVGEPELVKTIVPSTAAASLSIRLAAGQKPDVVGRAVEQLLEGVTPAGAHVEVEQVAAVEPALVSPDSPAIALAAEAFEQALGSRPLLLRSGGSLPILPVLTSRGIPTIVTGFAVPESNVHAPNERIPTRYVPLGIAAASEVLRRFSKLDVRSDWRSINR